MRLLFFVRDGCGACDKAKKKIRFFLEKWGVDETVETATFNLSTSDGLVEAAMRAVSDIPTILLEDADGEVARWTKRPPTSKELKPLLGPR